MTPLHVWALAGAAGAAALPVAIHFLTKPRGTRQPLPGFRFLLESLNQTARRNRLRNFLVLLVRTLAVVLIALAFARFIERSNANVPGADPGQRNGKVIVLDCSLSMHAASEGTLLFDRARSLATKELGRGDLAEADLVFAAQGARAVFGKLSANLTALRDEMAGARPLPQALDATAALDTAARSLAGLSAEDLKSREVVIISDLQRSNWTKASFARLPKGAPVRIVSVQGHEPLANIAIVRAGVSGMAEAGAPILTAADVANFGTASASATLELSFDGRTWSKKLELAPGAVESVPFEIPASLPGWRHGAFQLTCDSPLLDALREDNRYPLCVNVRKAREIALITTERAADVGGPAFFLERGLRASPDATVNVTRFTPAQLEGELDAALWRSNVVAVIQCGRLSDSQSTGLAKLLSGGVPILYAAQFSADADNMKSLEVTLGSALRLPVEFQVLKSGGTASGGSSALFGNRPAARDSGNKRFLVTVNVERRPFKVFGDAVARFTQGMALNGGLASSLRGDAGLDTESILASYSDGSAALVITRVAAGRLAVLNMPIGAAGQHLAAFPIFVPLIQELCADLVEGGSERGQGGAVCGMPFSLAIPRWADLGGGTTGASPAKNYRLERPSGEPVSIKGDNAPAFRTEGGNTVFGWSAAGEPGAYLIRRGDEVIAGFTVTPPFADESNLAALDHDVLTQRLAQDRTVSVVSADKLADRDDSDKEHFHFFFIAALGLVIAELGILKAFRT